MGTLTANSTRLTEHCEHKLPTSCRLSSIPNCCACADERAHAASYSTYIDGIGFVLRGSRWQRYCWFCKEFWEERVRVSGLRSGQTRIPENPDQSEFLKKWYEFHQGYRIVVKEDGSEERVAVLGEEFKDVSPGCLPRTLEELRSGRRAEEVQQAQRSAAQEQQESGPSIEITLDQMFDAAVEEANRQTAEASNTSAARPATNIPTRTVGDQVPLSAPSNIHAQAMNPAGSRSREYQMRRVAALRRELNRMRNGIERVITGLRDLGEDVPNETETTGRLTALGDTLDVISGAPSSENAQSAINSVNELTRSATAQTGTDRTLAQIQARVDDARTAMEEARRARDQAAAELDDAEQEFRTSQHRFHQVQREQRSTENYMRIFGTREEVIAQGENYVSPIGNMFSRAEERFRAAEQVRREERTLRQVLEDESRSGGEAAHRRLSGLEDRRRDVWGVPQQDPRSTNTAAADRSSGSALLDLSPTPPSLIPTVEESQLEEYYALLRRQDQQQATGTADPTNNNFTGVGVSQPPASNFPRNMLDAILVAREREFAEREAQVGTGEMLAISEGREPQSLPSDTVVEPPVDTEDWWHQDAQHIIRALTSDDALRDELGLTARETTVLLAYFMDDMLTESGRTTLDGLMRNPKVIWRTGLPAEWLNRLRDTHPESNIVFSGHGFDGAQDWTQHLRPYIRLESIAQAFQSSPAIRSRAEALTPPERLQMLYRLQAGRREDADIEVLTRMQEDPVVQTQAGLVLRSQSNQEEVRSAIRRAVQEHNSEVALHHGLSGDGRHLRFQRDTLLPDSTPAMALAAAGQAMGEGSQALFERLVDQDQDQVPNQDQQQDEGTRAAYQRLENSGFLLRNRRRIDGRSRLLPNILLDSDTDSDTDSDEEGAEAELRGLDAQDSGRPEPRDEAELMLDMGCSVCYTQLAEIACLPCGHLVMCKWCSEQHSPTMERDHTRPRRATACPVCRKGVRQKVRVFRA